MKESIPEGTQTLSVGPDGNTQPIPQYQRDPNRAERRWAMRRHKQMWRLVRNVKTGNTEVVRPREVAKGCFGSPKNGVTQLSADPHKFVAIEKPKAKAKRPRAKKAKE